jgi:hypothetical protein
MDKNGIRRAIARASARVTPAIAMFALCVLPFGRAAADDSTSLSFIGGGAFFSQTEKAERAIDPQIFVSDGAVAVGTGPQRIEHIAGLRNARLDDALASPIYNAEGMALGLTLRKWLAARGVLERQTQANGRIRLIASFKHLIPFGSYSLFAQSAGADAEKTVTVRPLDADGSASSFEAGANGSAMIVLETSPRVADDTAIVLVYHSDGREHGVSRGRLGVTAHEQLSVRL